MEEKTDVKENTLLAMDGRILDILLQDKTTGQNIIWATDTYARFGLPYFCDKPILPEYITGKNGEIIKPRIDKSKTERQSRIRDKAEVFTPSWICNMQNNLIDDAWFGCKYNFNVEKEKGWVTNAQPVQFPHTEGKDWQSYVKANRLEITCGEAPYLVSRYDAVTGEPIPIKDRIGILDRKLRVVNENTEDVQDWTDWAIRAIKATYGYEWQGDNLLLARENILYTFIDYYKDRFGIVPDIDILLQVADIIAWNIWQMDGLKGVVPNSCKTKIETQLSFFDDTPAEQPCEGCAKHNIFKHNGIYCYIMDWEINEKILFISLIKDDRGKHDK